MSEQEQTQLEEGPPHPGQQPDNTPELQTIESKAVESLPESQDLVARKFEPVHFLVAEDNKVNTRLFIRVIEQLGHDGDFVVNGEEAVEAYKKGHQTYQCILMDISMPVMGGFQALELIRTFEDENGLKPANIVALSAEMLSLFPQERDRLRSRGFTTAMRKPFHQRHLIEVLQELHLLREV
jgi:osomolarity two-component system, sensor histidine kinase NIK1